MTRTMHDSTSPLAIPLTAAMVAGYVDGRWPWMAPGNMGWVQARWPRAVPVRIAVFATTNDGHCLDVESGDASPAQAPGWVRMRRAAGADPSVYCNTSLWPAVRAAFHAAGTPEPYWWVASYPGGGATIPGGAVAHQYADPPSGSGGNFDLSVVADHWPGIDPGGPVTTPDSAADDATLAYIAGGNRVKMPDGQSRNVLDALYDITGRLMALAGQETAELTALSDEKAAVVAAVVAAVQALPPGGTLDPVKFAAVLAPALVPLLPAGTSPADLLHRMGAALDAAQ